MKVFITGGSGFLGNYLCSFLISNGVLIDAPTSSQCDLAVQNSLHSFNNEKYDFIFHLAAWTQAGEFCLHHPGEQWIINQKINTNVLEWWSTHHRNSKLILMGTSCAYSPSASLVETNYMLGEPIDSLYTYAMTKRMLYQGVLALSKQYGLSYLHLVPSTLYGPSYHIDGRQMHFIFDLIKKIIRAKEFSERVILWGDGNQSREIILVSDFVKIMWELCKLDGSGHYNIGAGQEFTIKEFAYKICQIVGYDFNLIEYDQTRYIGAKSKCLKIDKLRSKLNAVNLTPVYSGLFETVEWFYKTKAYTH